MSIEGDRIVVDHDVEDTLPPGIGPLQFVRERRRGAAGAAADQAYLGTERRRFAAPRLARRHSGLAVVRTCPDCGLTSITPYVPGAAAVAAALPCSCAAPAAASRARLRATVITWSLILLWVLNIEDVILTRTALSLGATEANAIMGFFLRYGFAQAALVKMGVVTAGSIFLWTQRRRPAVLYASVGLAAVYAAIIVFQVVQLQRIG